MLEGKSGDCLVLPPYVNFNTKIFFFSTFGVTGMKWRLAAKSACTTMASTFSGGCVAITYSMIVSGGKVEVLATINGVLGALVGVTGIPMKCNSN